MRNPAQDIQNTVSLLLTGIFYEGQPVEIYDQLAADDAGFYRIILLDVTGGGPRYSKCGFGGDWTQQIKISKSWPTGARVKKEGLNYIADEILQRLVPGNSALDIGPGFSIWKVEGNVLGDQSYSDGAKTYIDKNIRIDYSLIQL
jgi:hypothetical protein